MAGPMVSVIMPTYNQASFLKEALESVLNQTYRDFEILVIDNFSTDHTEEIVHSFHEERIRYFKFSNNGIIAASRNYGIREAKGRYLAFIDSDDIWLEQKLERQVLFLETPKNVDWIFTAFKVKSDDPQHQNKILGPRNRHLSDMIYNELLNFDFIVSSSVMVRKGVLEDIGVFDEATELACSEDFDLWLRISRKCHVKYIPEVLGIYRMHPFNSNVSEKRLQKALNVVEKHFSLGWATEKQASRAKANFYFREGWFLINIDAKGAKSYLYKALKLKPKSIRIIIVTYLGLLFCLFPSLFKFIRSRNLDRLIGCKLVNPQNL